MDQSLSGGSGNPSRMTLTVICSFRESSNIRKNYSMRGFLSRLFSLDPLGFTAQPGLFQIAGSDDRRQTPRRYLVAP
jgi:hypothetical protein